MTALAATGKAGARRRGRYTIMPLTYLVCVVLIGITVVPLLYVFISGFRTSAQLNASPTGLPSPWVWSNYGQILSSAPFWQFLGNSALVAVECTVIAVAFGSMAAYALSRYAFRGREFFYTVFVSGILFPIGVAALPLYLLLQRLGLLDDQFALGIAEAAFALPFTMLILRPFMRAIPGELEEAAMVEGASRFRFYWQILLPLCKPALITVSLLAFVQSWNQYLLPLLMFTTQSHFTLPLGVYTYQTQYTQNTAAILAFTALAAVPALAVFLFAERYIVAGAAGAVKG
jgi:raffinose/stachyose/melibiose transport system permease protein